MPKENSDRFLFSTSIERHYFACGIKAIFSLSALGSTQEVYSARFLEKNASFLSALLKPHDERFTYDLRLISIPDKKLFTRGKISVSLITRLDRGSAAEASACRVHLLNLLRATFDEYEFAALTKKQIQYCLEPFSGASIIELRRRCDHIILDSMSGYTPLQEVELEKRPASSTSIKFDKPATLNSAIHISPFVRALGDIGTLNRLLLSEAYPFAISYRLRPTKPTWAEESFFEEHAGACEKTLQQRTIHPTLRIQAQTIGSFHTERLFGLRNSAALAVIEIASPNKIPTTVIDSVGSQVTESTGERFTAKDAGPTRFFAGGYKIISKPDESARKSFSELEIDPPYESLIPRTVWRTPFLYDSNEAAAFFRFPPSTKEPAIGLPSKHWLSLAPPANLPNTGCRLGIAHHHAAIQSIFLGSDDRKRHIYVVGQTGTGKTTLLKTMILEDMRRGEGLCVIDPHGDLYHELLEKIPESRIDDVVLIDPTDADYPAALNLLECKNQVQRYFLAQEFVGIIRRLMQDEYGRDTQMIGPIFFQHMRMNLLLAMSNPDDPGTLLEFYSIYQSRNYWKRWIPLKIKDPILESWVNSVLPGQDYTKFTSDGPTMGAYIGSKFEAFVFEPLLRNVFGQKRNLVDFRTIMDEGKILLVNLAKGELTEENSRLLGMILMAKLMMAAMGRVTIPESKRRQFNLYVDEFQSIATSSFVTLLSEARKFGLSLVLANQFLTQIHDTKILEAVFGNVGTIISFRLGQEDAQILERKFLPSLNQFNLTNLPNWRAYISTLINGQTIWPFSFETFLDREKASMEMAKNVIARSRGRYARPKSEVEAAIEQSIEKEIPKKTNAEGDSWLDLSEE